MVSVIETGYVSDFTYDWAAPLRAAVSADILPLETFDEADPLGFAFYTLYFLRTGLITRANERLPATARQWAEAKLASGELSAYRDRDLGALGLLVYSFSAFGIPLRDEEGLARLVDKEDAPSVLLFDSFFLTSLIALGLAKTADGCPDRFVIAIAEAIVSGVECLRNDPKALLAGFWFARAIQRTDLADRLFRIAQEIFLSGTDHLDARLFSAAILVENLECMTMQRRLQVAKFAKDCIRSVGVEATGDSARELLFIEEGEFFSDPHHASRILVSVGLLCRDTLEQKSSMLLTPEARNAQRVRALVYSPFCAFLAVGVFWVGGRIRSSHPVISELLVAPSFPTAALVLAMLIVYTALGGVLAFALFALYELVFGLGISGKQRDEFAAFRSAWNSVKEHYKIELFMALLIGVIFDLLIRRG